MTFKTTSKTRLIITWILRVDTAGSLLIFVPRWTSLGALIIMCTIGLGTVLCFTKALYNPSFPMVMTLLAATLVWLARRPKLAGRAL
jgi:putative oxidoreductase